jgi:hypothetical protein
LLGSAASQPLCAYHDDAARGGTSTERATTMKTIRIIAGALLPCGFAVAGVGLGAGTAHAGAFHWCPGDPPPKYFATNPQPQHWINLNPAWDTTVCHDYITLNGHVYEGTPCNLPQFQWFMCPPGTTPEPQMVPTPNVGE